MDSFEMVDLITLQQRIGERYLEFFTSSEHLSMGLYFLKASEPDPQQPHTEDEIYYIVSGRGEIQVADENAAIQPGSAIFVGTGVDHRFHSITEDLIILVVFAPPRGSRA